MVHSAVNYYQENLPSHYTRETHERKLILTLQYFTMHSRGPAIYKYIQMIQSECDKFWNNGRKMCEELSLTGNCCIHRVHRLPKDDSFTETALDSNSDSFHQTLPVILHASMAKIISACNCGRRQANREDPFTVKSANYDFYLKMKHKCHTCRNITQSKFPVYENFDLDNLSSSQNMTFSKSENRDSPVSKSISETAFSQEACDDAQQNETECNDTQAQDVLSGDNLSNNDDLLDSPLDNNHDNYIVTCGSVEHERDTLKSDPVRGEDDSEKDALSNDKSDAVKPELFLSESSDNDEFEEKHFSSDEEFTSDPELNYSPEASNAARANLDVSTLPPMIHTLCTPNTLARFSSWSLVCLGSSSIYSHNLGIQDQQGFIGGSQFLLPWNVTVMLQHAKNMPPFWEGKRPPGIKHKKTLKGGRMNGAVAN